MLNKFLNNTLNKSSRALSEAKAKVEETAKKKVNDILGNNIPTPQDLETKLRNKLNNPTPEQLLEAERIYNRTLNLINSAIFRLEAKKSELQSIKTKLEGISGNLQGFRDFVDFLDPALKAFRAAIPGINGALAGSSGPAASGKLISDLTLKKKDIKESLKKANDAVESFKSPAFKASLEDLCSALILLVITSPFLPKVSTKDILFATCFEYLERTNLTALSINSFGMSTPFLATSKFFAVLAN